MVREWEGESDSLGEEEGWGAAGIVTGAVGDSGGDACLAAGVEVGMLAAFAGSAATGAGAGAGALVVLVGAGAVPA